MKKFLKDDEEVGLNEAVTFQAQSRFKQAAVFGFPFASQ